MKSVLSFLVLFSFAACAQKPKVTEAMDTANELVETMFPYYYTNFCPRGFNFQSLEKAQKLIEKTLQTLKQIDKEDLSKDEKYDYLITKEFVEMERKNYSLNLHLINIRHDSGPHELYSIMMESKHLSNEEDYKRYLSCIKEFPQILEGQIEFMKKSVELSFLQPQLVLKKFQKILKSEVKKTFDQTQIYKRFNAKKPEFLTEKKWKEIREEAKEIINRDYLAPLRKFEVYFDSEYLPKAPQILGISQYGKEYYEFLIQHQTTTDLTADQIHKLGLSEVKRIKKEINEIKKEMKFKGNFDEFREFMKTAPQFFTSDVDEYIKEITYIMKMVDSNINQVFNRLPRAQYGFKIMDPEVAKSAPVAYFQYVKKHDPNGYGTGYFVINTHEVHKKALYNLAALTLHEVSPGHYLHSALSRELEGKHPFLSKYGNVAFGEGWGLYAEYLGIDLGVYKTPESNFGRLNYEMWRATRLVVDTGIHAFNWTRDQAIQYMASNTSLSNEEIINEVDRYISRPGQALAYKIGELNFKKLRKDVSKHLGEKFNIRTFHDALLERGSFPLRLLNQYIYEKFRIKPKDLQKK